MPRNIRQSFPILVLALMLFTGFAAARIPVVFSKVEASSYAGEAEDLSLTIDGWNASPSGWSVGDETETSQAAIFTASQPIHADLLELTFSFLSGRPNASFADFVVSSTTDAKPSLEGNWNRVPLLSFSASTSELTLGPSNHLLATETPPVVTGMIPDELYRLSTRLLGQPITGFRIEVFPVKRSLTASAEHVMAWGMSGDFILTEFRAEILSTSTNVALGSPVTATHPLYSRTELSPARMVPGALTDGWPSTIAHPETGVPKEDFFFQIDLGQQRRIDHLGLRHRGDQHGQSRFGRMRIRLYEQDPESGAAPSWQILNRPDDSSPPMGAVDILHGSDGLGAFQGRYLRISSESPEQLTPQLAEVEVYETRTAKLVAILADERILPVEDSVQIPAGGKRLAFRFKIPQTGRPDGRLFRWRLSGEDKRWQTSDSLLLEIANPSAGDYEMVVQAAHSDGTWDSSVLKVAFVVKARFAETSAFLWLIGFGTLFVGVLGARYLSRRKIQRLEAQTALAAERSRIAANMHDDVGARLAQLAVLQDVFAIEHSLPPAAKEDLASLTSGTREAMAALDEAVWTVNPRNNTPAALAAFLMQHADSYLLPLGIACPIDSPSDWPDIRLRVGIRHEVALAFKEALQNVVKHAEASEVKTFLRHEGGQFLIRVTDDGCGMQDKAVGPGHEGLNNMRQRLESIGGTCEWLPSEKGSTVVEMKFPTA